MAWIQIDQSLPTHRKTRTLRRILKADSGAHVVGYVVQLWLWAVDNAPDGNLSGIDPLDAAEIAGWKGDPDEFMKALVDAGFVDPDMRLHNWDAHCGQLIASREKSRERARKKREADRLSKSADDTCTVREPYADGTVQRRPEERKAQYSIKNAAAPPALAYEQRSYTAEELNAIPTASLDRHRERG